MILSSDCLYVCDEVHCSARGRRSRFKSCTIMFLVRHFLFTSRQFYCRMCRLVTDTTKSRTAKISASRIAMGGVVTWPWLFQMRHFRRFCSTAIACVVRFSVRSAFLATSTLLVLFVFHALHIPVACYFFANENEQENIERCYCAMHRFRAVMNLKGRVHSSSYLPVKILWSWLATFWHNTSAWEMTIV